MRAYLAGRERVYFSGFIHSLLAVNATQRARDDVDFAFFRIEKSPNK